MLQLPKTPGEVEVYGSFSKHLGPRFSGAGVGVHIADLLMIGAESFSTA